MSHVAEDSAFDKAIRTVFSHVTVSPTATNVVGDDGAVHEMLHEPHWNEGLGKQLCIMDNDNREFNEEGQTWYPQPFIWEDQKNQAAGVLNHYLYGKSFCVSRVKLTGEAVLHGYRYNYVVAPKYEGERTEFWSKIPAISDMLHSGCKIVVTIDHDAIFANLHLPFEWLMNRWNFTGATSLGMALDNHITPWNPSGFGNEDDFGEVNVNAGFIIAQDNARTHEILRAWDSCPSNETQYPNCRKFIKEWPAEQGAYGTYIRRQFTRPDDLLVVPCTEGNGFPGMNTECQGVFVRHFTTIKTMVTTGTAASLAQSFFGMVRSEIVHREGEVKIQRETNGFTKSFDLAGGGIHGDPVRKEGETKGDS
jgi:hypothetical protein